MRNTKELFRYVVGGGLTTIVNFVVYFFLNNVTDTHYLLANLLSIVVAIVFAFFINKFFVFQKKDTAKESLLKEFFLFGLFRAFAGLFDMLILGVLVGGFSLNSNLAKIITEVGVVVINYLTSKLVVFKEE